MGAREARQGPRRTSHETMGTLSYQAMGARHLGQRERGCTSDSPAGRRATTTFKKLPTAPPTRATQAAASGAGTAAIGFPGLTAPSRFPPPAGAPERPGAAPPAGA